MSAQIFITGCTQSERAAWAEAAKADGLTVPRWVTRVLNRAVNFPHP